MKITDKEALKELKRTRSSTLWDALDGYPEDEREGRSDLQMIADECSYIVSCFDEGGHVFCEDLEWAREVLRETKNGKVMPLWAGSLQPKYRKSDIQNARDVINEQKRLCSLIKRLNEKKIYGRW